MNKTISGAIVSKFQLDSCLETARNTIVECDIFLRWPAADNYLKTVRVIRKRLYAVFSKADDIGGSAFELSKEVEACVKELAAVTAMVGVVH